MALTIMGTDYHIKHYCQGRTKAGWPCQKPANVGSDYCRWHQDYVPENDYRNDLCDLCGKFPKMQLLEADRCAVCAGIVQVSEEGRVLLNAN